MEPLIVKFLNGVGIGHLVDSKTCKNIWACLVVEINTFFFFFPFCVSEEEK